MMAHASLRVPNFTKKHFKNSPHFIYVLGHALGNACQQNSPLDGASVLACAYQLKVRSKNPKIFEYWFCRRLWVKFVMFLLNSTSVDAGAIIGDKVETHQKLGTQCITEWNLFHSNPSLLKNSININCLRQTE